MLASKFIARLEAMIVNHGDLPICGGDIMDDIPPKRIIALNKSGEDIRDSTKDKNPIEFYIAG